MNRWLIHHWIQPFQAPFNTVHPLLPMFRNTLPLLLGLVLCAPSQAAFSIVNTGSDLDGSIDASAGTKTINVTAGAADLLVIGTSTEFGTGTVAGWSATYAGNTMSFVTGDGIYSNIFYLDLSQTSYTGGSAALTLSWDYTAGGDLGIGWASARVDGGLGAGETIGVHTDTRIGSETSIDLTTTVDETFNFVNFNGNRGGTGNLTLTNLTEIYDEDRFGSNAGAAGYDIQSTAGTTSYSWNATDPRTIDAAAFVVVPEPSAAAMIGLGGLLLLVRRRK